MSGNLSFLSLYSEIRGGILYFLEIEYCLILFPPKSTKAPANMQGGRPHVYLSHTIPVTALLYRQKMQMIDPHVFVFQRSPR